MSKSWKPDLKRKSRQLGEDFEKHVIDHADKWQVARFLGSAKWDRRDYALLLPALLDAQSDPRALLYAITNEGRHALVPKGMYT